MAARVRLAAGIIAVVVALAFALAPMSVSGGYSCDGAGGPVRWLTGAGTAARSAATRQQADMAKVLSDLASNPSITNTPMGREAQDDANDAHNRAQAAYPSLDACDSAAELRLALAIPVGLAAGGLILVLAWAARRAWLAIVERRRRQAAPPPALCPVCGSPLGVDSICAQCNSVRVGTTEQWWDRLPQAPPTHVSSEDDRPAG